MKDKISVLLFGGRQNEDWTRVEVEVTPIEPKTIIGRLLARWLGNRYAGTASWVDIKGQVWRQEIPLERTATEERALRQAMYEMAMYHRKSRHICGHCAEINRNKPKPVLLEFDGALSVE